MKRFDYKFKALGTGCVISIVGEKNIYNEIINNIYKQIQDFENTFSRFRQDSVLSKLNKEKSLEVNADFLTLIDYSKKIYKLTNGYFNPLININNIGYSNSFEENNFKKKETKENLDFLNIKNYGDLVELEENMNLDFGSIAKGYFADKTINYLKSKKINNALVNIGGDISTIGKNHLGKDWRIGIKNPLNNNENILTQKISNKSISTSGIYLRSWEINGEKYHHIKNPNSNTSNHEILSCSIISDKGYKTDALATAVISMGLEIGIEFCDKNNIEYIIIDKDLNIFTNKKEQ